MPKQLSGRVVKSIIKKHKPNLKIESDTDILIYLNCLLFLHKLTEESRLKALEDKSRRIKPAHVKAVAKAVLKKFRG
ncbi:centromere protein W [Rhinophrynus dorsalis]